MLSNVNAPRPEPLSRQQDRPEDRALHSASLVLAPLLERLVVGRRVVILGVATLGLATELTARGARLVHVYDPDAGRAAQAMVTLGGRNIAYAPLSEDLGIREGAFDVAILPDLGLFAHPASAIARARQLAGPRGLVVVGSEAGGDDGKTPRTPEQKNKLGYYELYDALSLAFREVKMLGQLAFSGYALVDFGAEGDVAVSVDTSLAEESPREPKFFLALGSDAPILIEDYTIVEVPGHADVEEVEAAGASVVAELRDEARRVVAEAAARAEGLRAELEVQLEARRFLELRVAEEARLKHEIAEVARQWEQRGTEATLIAREAERRLHEVAERLRIRDAQASHQASHQAQSQASSVAATQAANQAATQAANSEGQTRAAALQQRVIVLEHELGTLTRDLARSEEELRRAAAREQQAARVVAELRTQARAPAPAQDLRPLEEKLKRAVDEQRLAEAKLAKVLDEVKDHRALEIKLTKALEDLRLAEGRAAVATEQQRILAQRLEAQKVVDEQRVLELQRALDQKRAAPEAPAAPTAELRELEQKLARASEAQRLAEERLAQAMVAQRALEAKLAQAETAQRAAETKLAQALAGGGAGAALDDGKRKEAEARLVKVLDERHVLAAQAVTLVAQNQALEAERTALAARLARAQKELDHLQDAQSGDFIAGENVLRERAREIAVLKREVERRGDLVKELLHALEAAREGGMTPLPAAADQALAAELERRRTEVLELGRDRGNLLERLAAQGKETTGLAADLSTLRAELQRVTREHGERQVEASSLREKLAALAVSPESRVGGLDREIDALRKALLEERAARVRAEEGRAEGAATNERAVLGAQVDAAKQGS